MSRDVFALQLSDVAAFARTLVRALEQRHEQRLAPPGQVELLNLIARSQGCRNWAALRQALARPAPVPQPAPAPALSTHACKALGHFDAEGRLTRWPARLSVQKLAMWALWTHFDAKRSYTEREVNAVLRHAHTFGDHATLRRELINHRLMARQSDCSDYRKLPARPDAEARAFIGAWRAACALAGRLAASSRSRSQQPIDRQPAQHHHRGAPRP